MSQGFAHAEVVHSAESLPRDVQFVESMRLLAGTVCVIVTKFDGQRAGLTATAVTSFSAEPPEILVCVNRSASAYRPLMAAKIFSVNVLQARNVAIAKRFAGVDGCAGEARFAEAQWDTLETGVPCLTEALVSLDCHLSHVIERNDHAVLIGSVVATAIRSGDPLLYAQKKFHTLAEI
jgi:flavin reductase (DIM6/NTAB) family NADH-FMN oxidoreductase RutF